MYYIAQRFFHQKPASTLRVMLRGVKIARGERLGKRNVGRDCGVEDASKNAIVR
jgi:hypothetical protein